LKSQLRQAISEGRIKKRYEAVQLRREREDVKAYAKRLAATSAEGQFVHVAWGGRSHYVAFGISGPVVTRHGEFMLIPAQVVGGRWGVHYCLIQPSLEYLRDQESILTRIDSGCMSGQLFGDLTCDCKEQLEIGLSMCARKGAGIVVSIPAHDGRGWGEYKMANQRLMHECGLNTVEAARIFYGGDDDLDQRTYEEAVIILRALGFNSKHQFRLATNSPRKVGAFTSSGMNVEVVESVVAKNINKVVQKNLNAKSREWRHSISS
jgi:GTP cyclohydrolase II